MKVLGINDEVTTCECCGRTNLKKTVVLGTEDGEVRYGTECAARALGRAAKEVAKESKTAQKAKDDEAARIKRVAEWEAEKAYYGWLQARYGENRSTIERWRAYKVELVAA